MLVNFAEEANTSPQYHVEHYSTKWTIRRISQFPGHLTSKADDRSLHKIARWLGTTSHQATFSPHNIYSPALVSWTFVPLPMTIQDGKSPHSERFPCIQGYELYTSPLCPIVILRLHRSVRHITRRR